MTENREKIAFNAIKSSLNTEQGEDSIDLFISHHLEELNEEIWVSVTGKAKPTAQEVLEIMVLKECWDDGLAYDFTLPNEVTNYVVSVTFDADGNVEDISMES